MPLRLLLVSRTKINWGKVLNALFDERSCLNFFFLRFYGPGMLSLDFCLEGKGVSKTGRGSEVKNKAILVSRTTTGLNLYKIVLLCYSSLFVFTRDKTSAIIILGHKVSV